MVPTVSSLALRSQRGPPSRRPRSRSVPGSRLRPGPSSRRLDERCPNQVDSGRFGAFNDRGVSEELEGFVPTAYGLRIAWRLLKKAAARKSSDLTERYMYSIRSRIPHSGEAGLDGATVLDVFSPV